MAENFLSGLPPEYQAELQKLFRRQQMAQAMQQQAFSGLSQPTQFTGGKYSYPVKTNPLTSVLQALTGYMAGKQGEEAQAGIADVSKRASTAQQEALAKILSTPLEQRGQAAAASQFPSIQQQAPFFQSTYENQANRGQRAEFKTGDWEREDRKLGIDEKRWAADAEYRNANLARLNAELEDSIKRGDQVNAARLEQLKQGWARIGIERDYKGRVLDIKENAPAVKPLPPAALRLQNEEIDAIQTAKSINADMGALEKQLDEGKLTFGPVENILNKARNYAGASTEKSRNFASANATLEKMRNDSLRLNKGVQTEGDSVRAWNELFANVNDPGVVKQRLQEIRKINERAANLRQMQLDQIRSNYQLGPLDIGTIAPALGGGATEEQLPPGVKRVK